MDEFLVLQRASMHEYILKVAKHNARFQVKTYTEFKLLINGARVATHIINNDHIMVFVIVKGETVLKIRHYNNQVNTANMVLNFINQNLF